MRCLPEVLRSELSDVSVFSDFDNVLEVHDDVPGTIDGVLQKVISSEERLSSEEEEEETVAVPKEPPTHQKAVQCINELERYVFVLYNQPEMIETLFGLCRKIESEWARSKIEKSKQSLVTDFFTKQ